MKKSGFNLQEVSSVTDHANYQSLESYLNAPDDEDMERYAEALYNFHDDSKENTLKQPKRKPTPTIPKPPEVPEFPKNQLTVMS